ncbi:MAG: nucleoside triphosphate pyrophosphohydrolase [Rhodospirillaceae bacterium]
MDEIKDQNTNKWSEENTDRSGNKGRKTIADLIQIMARLRNPENGCPWDIEQTFKTIAPYTIEEAYEVADAILRDDMPGLLDELGDLLLQVVYHSRIAEEAGLFDFTDVANSASAKMLRRHPHVFSDSVVKGPETQTVSWETIKAAERAKKGISNRSSSNLDDVPVTLPAMKRAEKLQKRAARVGFDWPEVLPVLDKIREEITELEAEIRVGAELTKLENEVGDILFAVINLSRKLKVESDSALRQTNRKFEKRFRFIEDMLAANGRRPEETSLQEMESLWELAKKEMYN